MPDYTGTYIGTPCAHPSFMRFNAGVMAFAVAIAISTAAHAARRAQDAAPAPAAAAAPTAQSLYLRALEERGEGKTSTAKKTLDEAIGLAMHERGATARATEKKIRSELSSLEPLLSRVTITSADTSEGLRVDVDGDKESCRKLPCTVLLDQGTRKVVASAAGKKPWEATLSVAAGTTEVRLPMLAIEEPPPPPEPNAPDKVIVAEDKERTTFTLGMSPAGIFRTGSYQAGTTALTVMHLEYNRFQWLKPFVKLGFAYNSPVQGMGAIAMSSPGFGITSSHTIAQKYRVSAIALGTMPLSGSTPEAGVANAATAVRAREGTDMTGRMFDIEFYTFGGGVDLGYVPNPFSVTSRTRVTRSIRTRGEGIDRGKDVFTTSLELAWSPTGLGLAGGDLTFFVDPRLAVWLSTPEHVAKDSSAREQVMLGGGARWNARMGKASRFSSMLGFYRAMDPPLSRTAYNQLEADIAVSW